MCCSEKARSAVECNHEGHHEEEAVVLVPDTMHDQQESHGDRGGMVGNEGDSAYVKETALEVFAQHGFIVFNVHDLAFITLCAVNRSFRDLFKPLVLPWLTRQLGQLRYV